MIPIFDYKDITIDEIFNRQTEEENITAQVSDIIGRVRKEGDAALGAYCQRFDDWTGDILEVSPQERALARAAVDPVFIEILEEAAEHIRLYHEKQKREGFQFSPREGVILGQKVTPLDRVGIYVPGGTASYPSSVLMNGIPAKIAGVGEVIMVTPAKGGILRPEILVAAELAGIDRIFKIGGAQGVAALAYGTETVPRVDKIVGPGNAFVAEAKKQVFGKVAIDMIAGPSEILVIADEKSDPGLIAADLLSQGEHDIKASAVLVTDSKLLAQAVQQALEEQIPKLLRKDIARLSIDREGKIILAQDIHQGIEIANQIAPEHLELSVDDPFSYLDEIRHAGSIFLGRYAPEALGDYFAGPNHTLPTGGTARFSSPLSVDDFIKKSSFTYYTKEALIKEGAKIDYFAAQEGLTAHGRSVTMRLEKEGGEG